MRFHSVKVITFASHAKGSEFNPQWNQYIFFFFFFFFFLFFLSLLKYVGTAATVVQVQSLNAYKCACMHTIISLCLCEKKKGGKVDAPPKKYHMHFISHVKAVKFVQVSSTNGLHWPSVSSVGTDKLIHHCQGNH